MVYKYRNKAIFWTRAGWMSNHRAKTMSAAISHKRSSITSAITHKYDYYSFLRITNSYRYLSRHAKQYCHGDKFLEESIILALRYEFHQIFDGVTKVAELKFAPERRMADQLDRDCELLSYNQHPQSLFMYEVNNKRVEQETLEYEKQQRGELTSNEEMVQEFGKIVEAEQKKYPKGEKIPFDRMTDLLMDFMRRMRENRSHDGHRMLDDTGNVLDYLEVRRPHVKVPGEKHFGLFREIK